MIAKANIVSNHTLSQQVRSLGIKTMGDLMTYVQAIPYGRSSDRSRVDLVLLENRGTCSSKHALIKAIAQENDLEELQLIIGIYKMTKSNTPNIGDPIERSLLSYIPEAHCYLKSQKQRIDVTANGASFERIAADLLEEQEIKPSQIGQYKVDYHQQYLKDWIAREDIPLDFEAVWAIREACIANLSN